MMSTGSQSGLNSVSGALKMAASWVRVSAVKCGLFIGVSALKTRSFGVAAALCKQAAPLGPMPNEHIDVKQLDSLEKYRSYTRYLKVAEEESKKPHWWKTYKHYLSEKQDDEVKIDIGLPVLRQSRKKEMRERRQIMKENHKTQELERASRNRTLLIPLDEVKAEWEKNNGQYHMQNIAEHYGIFRDLFNGATFVPRVMLRVEYSHDDENVMPVHLGNVVVPTEARAPPQVSFEAEEGSLWTLLLTNLDGHLRDNDSEYIHWLVGNITGPVVESGEEVCHYFPLFPAKGTGYHRFVFILFKQDQHIDFKDEYRPSPCHSLKMRTFKTFDFYKKHQDFMTPAGLCFFQSKWDDSVTYVYHQLLNMKEPIFTYDRLPVYHPPQKKYPHGQPLRYLDRYRDSHEPTYGIY
uniref:Large ribosomal subunit protein mL38 n=2 Tax=Latimeria chalumnae TaxID=7897 RepID=H2ZUN8_LATCH|nr:PREDICTED: 39S ribosomal protein L38, mitochondrial isoform X2 [Latimeria chalumnae]|eukprot:XP_006011475.1 PREDICTED: 39S ribosomal protein L38, mitochondrial isoform X2 [Latimeria chalumnae]